MDEHTGVAERVAGSMVMLVGRRFVIMALTAISTGVIARFLSPEEFGALYAAVAIYFLGSAVSDFGFSLVLGRDLAIAPEGRANLFATALRVQLALAAAIAVVVAAIGVASGLDGLRGQLLIILAAGIASSGLEGGRQVFFVLYRVRTLAKIDVTMNVAQAALIVAVAAIGGGAIGVAAVMSGVTVVTSVLVFTRARRLIGDGRSAPGAWRSLLRKAAPLGLASLMSSVYFSGDLVLLGWLVSGPELGHYAAAVKILSLLVAIPGLVMLAAMPGLASTTVDAVAQSALAARIWHWLLAAGMPFCVGCAVFAGPIVTVAFGDGYEPAVSLIRILCIAAALAFAANVLGTLLVAQSVVRPILVLNAVAIVFNIGGNLALVPRYGVTASAWLTVATEAIVTASSLAILLRRGMKVSPALVVSVRPTVALVVGGALGVALAAWPWAALPVGAAAFAGVLLALRAWPVELRPARYRADVAGP